MGKTYSTFPRGIESEANNIFNTYHNGVRPIRHSHGELKEERGGRPYELNPAPSKTYSTFPRGIESRVVQPSTTTYFLPVRPIRHSHGELKGMLKCVITGFAKRNVRPIRHSHGELKVRQTER